jgi:hypothetical protein
VSDAIRFVVITLAVLTGAGMLTGLLLHLRAWRAEGSDVTLPPLHVALVCTSYALIALLLALGVLDGLGKPMTWRVPGYGVALLLGLVALWVANRRRRRLTRKAPR